MQEANVEKRADQAVVQEPVFQKVAPLTDIRETAEAFHLVIDLPGVGQGDLEVHVEDNVLSIQAKAGPVDPGGRAPHICEYGPREYSRSFQVPQGLDYKKIDARLKDGVLSVAIPKGEEVRPRKIDVKGVS